MTIVSVLGLLGLGSVLTVLAQHLLARSAAQTDRRNRELKEAYSGFLDALSRLLSNPELDEKDVNFRYWVARVQLVCSKEILDILLEMKAKSRRALTAQLATEFLIFAMRRDLGIARDDSSGSEETNSSPS